MNSIIKVRNFTKKYGDFIAVNDISFEEKKALFSHFLDQMGQGKVPQ